MPNWRRLVCCCNPRKKATASLGMAAPIPNSNHSNEPPPPLPGDRGLLTDRMLAARAKALNLHATTRFMHSENQSSVIGPNERHGPQFIAGCASAWALANGRPVYAHCSDGGTSWRALREAASKAGARLDQVSEIRVTRPALSDKKDLTPDDIGHQDLEEAEEDVEKLQEYFPNATITFWFVERGTTTFFNGAGEPSRW
ncbi:hypothetical protein [Sorangium sp. So ce1078]|uniref:hypothetical protein n=1 Tax=Sorangium sp. So ce1078 TaxID=3133329 RepID=UPI003F5ECD09